MLKYSDLSTVRMYLLCCCLLQALDWICSMLAPHAPVPFLFFIFNFFGFKSDEAIFLLFSYCCRASSLILVLLLQTIFRRLIASLFLKIPSLLGDKPGNPEAKAEEELLTVRRGRWVKWELIDCPVCWSFCNGSYYGCLRGRNKNFSF